MVSTTVLLGLLLITGPAFASGELETEAARPEPAPVSAGAQAEPDVMPAEAMGDAPADDPVAEEPESLAPLPPGAVARAQFTTGVVGHEPTDKLDQLTTDYDQVAFFTEFVGIQGASLVHRWEYAGQVVAEVPFEIGGPRWRVYSTKKLLPGQIGEWTVSVVDPAGRVLETQTLDYLQPVPETPGKPEVPAAPAGVPSKP